MRNQVSDPHNAVKITAFDIFMCMFPDSIQQDTKFETEWHQALSKFNLILIFSVSTVLIWQCCSAISKFEQTALLMGYLTKSIIRCKAIDCIIQHSHNCILTVLPVSYSTATTVS
jgi:hypothetical protein